MWTIIALPFVGMRLLDFVLSMKYARNSDFDKCNIYETRAILYAIAALICLK